MTTSPRCRAVSAGNICCDGRLGHSGNHYANGLRSYTWLNESPQEPEKCGYLGPFLGAYYCELPAGHGGLHRLVGDFPHGKLEWPSRADLRAPGVWKKNGPLKGRAFSPGLQTATEAEGQRIAKEILTTDPPDNSRAILCYTHLQHVLSCCPWPNASESGDAYVALEVLAKAAGVTIAGGAPTKEGSRSVIGANVHCPHCGSWLNARLELKEAP